MERRLAGPIGPELVRGGVQGARAEAEQLIVGGLLRADGLTAVSQDQSPARRTSAGTKMSGSVSSDPGRRIR